MKTRYNNFINSSLIEIMRKTLFLVFVFAFAMLMWTPVISFAASFFYVSDSGSIGIGNSSPQHMLDVSGAMYSRLVNASSTTINWNSGNVQMYTLSSNQTLTFSNGQAGGNYTLILKQDGTGNRTVSWPVSVIWPNGTSPTLSTSPDSIDQFNFVYTGSEYLGSYSLHYNASSVTWNPSDKSSGITLSNGDKTATLNTTGWRGVRSSAGKSSGKWYWEVTITAADANRDQFNGIATNSVTLDPSSGNYADVTANTVYLYYGNDGNKTAGGGSTSAYGSTYTTGDVIQVALDMDNGKVWFGKNGTWQNSGNPASGTNPAFTGISGTFYPFFGANGGSQSVTANFGASSFSYSAPSGFTAGL